MARAATGGRLRVLTYHDVPDTDALLAQLRALSRSYRFISGDDVAAAVTGRTPLPRAALWVTFDDGHARAFAVAKSLATEGVAACMFICPALLGTTKPFWWQVVDEAAGLGLLAGRDGLRFSRSRLKSLPDRERRAEVAVLEARVSGRLGRPQFVRQATHEDVARWLAAGHEIGNHTWDHPCLNRCSSEEQRRQVRAAHEALADLGQRPRWFAYPNGDHGPAAEREARELGYLASFLFDHRCTRLQAHPHRLSRLRLDASAPVPRARAIASGAHSAAYGFVR